MSSDNLNASSTSVENRDLASALSQSHQDKLQHVSCESCTERNVPCNGEPSGCDECLRVLVECRYPNRDTHESMRLHLSSEDEVGMGSNTNDADRDMQNINDADQDMQDIEEENRPIDTATTRELDSAQPGGEQLQGSAASLGAFNVNSGSNLDIKPWVPSNTASGSGTAVGTLGRDEWPDTTIDPSLITRFDAVADGVGAVDQQHNAAPFKDTERCSECLDKQDSGQDVSPNSAPSLQAPMAALNDSLAPSNHHQSATSRTRGDNNNNHHAGNNIPGHLPDPDGLKAFSPMSFNKGQKVVALGERQNPQNNMTSAPHLTSGLSMSTTSCLTHGNFTSVVSTSTTSFQSQEYGCRCADHSVHLLEQLGSSNGNKVLIHVLLGLLRNAITHCTTVLECKSCNHRREPISLLAIICQYMTGIYEQVVRGCIGKLEDMVRNRAMNPNTCSMPAGAPPLVIAADGGSGGASNDCSNGEADNMWYSTYSIESTCERMHVLTTIVMVQITEFSNLLRALRMRGIQGSQKILVQAERTTSLTQQTLQNGIKKATATKMEAE
ncbi:Uncharacterized protein TCAP_00429 [Tolypocladium capitatum]|uniref:Zn(2)-C6 fungal-type domain-containing protein n=1 Tax=Tolypocladium capitatum TaxID=45235 RepID=A0A2K3QQ50_9HYPO|nr:Uncharacterized protein TCAP_00429 [Tolypocladium capitatum]